MASSSSKTLPFARLPDTVKDQIFGYAGREAIFAYIIATGGKDKDKWYVRENAFYEPFTYWDWYDTRNEEGREEKRKRRLYWEREKGFRANGGPWSSYPTAKRRWEDFKRLINDDTRWSVKRIAVAYWMTMDDWAWISEELPVLEALDVSNFDPNRGIRVKGMAESTWPMILAVFDRSQPRILDPSDLEHFLYFKKNERKASIIERLHILREKQRIAQTQHSSQNTEASKAASTQTQNELQAYSTRVIAQQQQYIRTLTNNDPSFFPSVHLRKILHTAGTPNTLKRLRWLGVLSDHHGQEGQDVFHTIVRACERLETLSIRTSHEYGYSRYSEISSKDLDAKNLHEDICQLILDITGNVSKAMTTIELRQSLEFLPYFIKKIHDLKPSIQRVGIDLGAWIQLYPIGLKFDSPRLLDDLHRDRDIQGAMERVAGLTANFAKRLETSIAGGPSKELPCKASDERLDADAIEEKDARDDDLGDDEYRKRNSSFYCGEGGTDLRLEGPDTSGDDNPSTVFFCPLDQTRGHSHTRARLDNDRVHTLLRMLRRLYDVGHGSTISLFPLDPETEHNSTRPIHPFALIQESNDVRPNLRSKYKGLSANDDHSDVYRWLDKTFNWRPVFDWDFFMVPERMQETDYRTYSRMLSEQSHYMGLIAKQFNSLRKAGIPIHLLIGRRKDESTSCYWGWPYNEEQWKSWLDRDFDAGLDDIAGLIDTLSIFYNLQNPLDKPRLEEIEAIKPHSWPVSICPALPCPWSFEGPFHGSCPFLVQREPSKQPNVGTEKQKMANKKALEPKKPRTPVVYERLANACASAPPVGENANDHPTDDDDTIGKTSVASDVSLHHLARGAVFTREAVGWQRFWAKYALKLTSLSTLRVRMPRSFDKIGSYRLAKLLEQSSGWEMLTYTDERQHVQTEYDLVRRIQGIPANSFEHPPEAKQWPAGRFVRRSWVWPEKQTRFRSIGGIAELHNEYALQWKNRTFTEEDVADTHPHEDKELIKAIQRAETAAQREHAIQTELDVDPPKRKQQAAQQKLRNKQLYNHGVRNYAQQQWEAALQHHIGRLEDQLARAHEDEKKHAPDSVSARDIRQHQAHVLTMIKWLQQRQREDPPILGDSKDDKLEETGHVLQDIGFKRVPSKSDRSWIPEHWHEGQNTLHVPSVTQRPRKASRGAALSPYPRQEDAAPTASGVAKRKRSSADAVDTDAVKRSRTGDVPATDVGFKVTKTVITLEENITTTIPIIDLEDTEEEQIQEQQMPPASDPVAEPTIPEIRVEEPVFEQPRVDVVVTSPSTEIPIAAPEGSEEPLRPVPPKKDTRKRKSPFHDSSSSSSKDTDQLEVQPQPKRPKRTKTKTTPDPVYVDSPSHTPPSSDEAGPSVEESDDQGKKKAGLKKRSSAAQPYVPPKDGDDNDNDDEGKPKPKATRGRGRGRGGKSTGGTRGGKKTTSTTTKGKPGKGAKKSGTAAEPADDADREADGGDEGAPEPRPSTRGNKVGTRGRKKGVDTTNTTKKPTTKPEITSPVARRTRRAVKERETNKE